jgi:hypothetical protein
MFKQGKINKLFLGVLLLTVMTTSTMIAQPVLADTRNITIAAPTLLSATFYPPSQIKLKWIDNSNNETKFTVKLITTGVFGPGQPITTRTEYRDLPANTSTFMLPYVPGVGTQITMNASAPNGASAWSNPQGVDLMPNQPNLYPPSKNSAGDYLVSWMDNSFNEGLFVLVVASNSEVKVFGYKAANPPVVPAPTPTPNLSPTGVVKITLKASGLPTVSQYVPYKFFVSAVAQKWLLSGFTGNGQVMDNSFLKYITIPADSPNMFLTTNNFPPLPKNLYGSQVIMYK